MAGMGPLSRRGGPPPPAILPPAPRGRAALRAYEAAPYDSALTQRRTKSMPGPIALGQIGQISRQVSDIDRAVTWYRDVLGLPHLYTFGSLAFFDCAGIRLFLRTPAHPG